MPEPTNTITNTLGLVKPPQVISQIFPQPIYPEVGFGLELFRNGIHIGSLYPGQTQPLSTKKGDTLYRINLGPHIYPLSGKLRTSEGYTREYSIQVEFQVQAPSRFLDLYRQGRDPVYQAVLDIQAAIQEYADRTTYEQMQPANITAKATYAFAKEPDNLKAGLRVLGVHKPVLGDDPTYQPIDLHPVIAVNGQLTTREGYVRNYALTAELLIHDSQIYREAEARGNVPLDRAKDAINHALQLYARQNYYEDLLTPQLHNIVGHAFHDLSNQYIGGLKIINIHNLSLGVDKNYEPINLSPIITTRGRLTTREDYVRSYEITIELQVTNYQLYRHLKYTDTQNTPLDRATIAIEGKLQEYARQQFYEDLTDSHLRPVIAQSFDGLDNRIHECLAVVRVHRLMLGEDTTYQAIDLSPLLTIRDQFTTRENYVRPYEVVVELQITDRWPYLQLTREGAEPLHLAEIAIKGVLQTYARQQFYEDFSEVQLLAVVAHAFDDLSNRVTGGLEIVRPHRFSLGANATYQPLNLSPLLTLEGTVTTQEGYVRSYELVVELLINDRRLYQQLLYEGSNPLEHAKITINGELQKYVRQQFYEDLSESQLTVVIERSFDTLASRVVGDIAIVGVHHFSLEADEHYQPINLSPLLEMHGELTTRDGYVRDYDLVVELLINDRRAYQQLVYEGVDPLERAKVAIDGELQQYARQQFYEELLETQLYTIVEQVFDDLGSRTTGHITIVRAHHLFLGDDKNYKPINLSPLLTISGQVITLEDYECDYEFSVELLIKELRSYQELIHEGIEPLNYADVTIKSEFQKYARQHMYEGLRKDLSEAQLHTIVEQAFNTLSSRVTSTMEIVRAYQLFLKEPVGYIHLGPRTLTISGKLKTTDFLERAYEITVLLVVVNPPRFTQLTRQGGDSDPLKLVQVAIEGAIYKAADGKTHDELSELNLPQAAHKAFTPFPEAMIAGLKITEAHRATLQVDPSLQERAKIVHQATTEKTRLASNTELEKIGSKSNFEIARQAEQQEFDLVQLRQAREKFQYLYELEKQGIVKAHELRASLAEGMITQFATRISEDIGAGVSFAEIAEGKKMLDGFMQPSIPQNTIGQANVSPTQIQNVEPSQHNILEPGETQSQISQVSSVSSVSKRRRKRIPIWGVEVVEVSLPQASRALLDEQEYAFQVCDLSEEAPVSDSYFQETDILIKINNRRVYTLEALENTLTSLQPSTKVTVIVLRDELRVKLMLDSPHDADSQ